MPTTEFHVTAARAYYIHYQLKKHRRLGPTRPMTSSFIRFLYHTHNDAPQSVGLLWTSDQLVAETSN